MPSYYKCAHCTDLRPPTEVNGDLLECGACGLFSRTDIAIHGASPFFDNTKNVNAIKMVLAQEPQLETATEVRLRKLYVDHISFLLRELGEL